MKNLRINNDTKNFTNKDDKSAELILSSIAKCTLISPEEEIELTKLIQQGDEQARNKLVNANLRFLVSVAKAYQNRGLELGDLISEGSIGLVKAAEKFDGKRGVKFCSFAIWHVRQSIQDALTELGHLVRLPHNQVTMLHRIKDFVAEYEQQNDEKPTIEAIAEALNLDPFTAQDIMAAGGYSMSLDVPVSEDSKSPLHFFFAATDDTYADSALQAEEEKHELNVMLTTVLDDREAYIIRHSYGLDGDTLSLDDIAHHIGLCIERTRQLRIQAIKKMRKYHQQMQNYRLCC